MQALEKQKFYDHIQIYIVCETLVFCKRACIWVCEQNWTADKKKKKKNKIELLYTRTHTFM